MTHKVSKDIQTTQARAEFQKQFECELIEKYGNLVSGEELSNLLGFSSNSAFRQGLIRGVIDVPIISFENRRGKFALAKDIAEYLTNRRFEYIEKKSELIMQKEK